MLDPGWGRMLLWPQRLYSIYNFALSQHLLLQAVGILKGGTGTQINVGMMMGTEVNDLMVQISAFLQWTLTHLKFPFALSSLELY